MGFLGWEIVLYFWFTSSFFTNRNTFFGYFQLEAIKNFKVQDFTASRFCWSRACVMSPHITLFAIILSFHLTAFRKTDLSNHSFPKIYCILGFILTAHGSQQLLIVRCILQCIVGNFNEPTRNTPSRQYRIFYKSKSRSKSPLIYRPGT